MNPNKTTDLLQEHVQEMEHNMVEEGGGGAEMKFGR